MPATDDKSDSIGFMDDIVVPDEAPKAAPPKKPKEAPAPVKAAPQDDEEKPSIYAIKTSIGHEKMVANGIERRARARKVEIYSILSPTKLRGYVLLEGRSNKDELNTLIKGLEHAKRIVEGFSNLDEILHFLTPKPLVSGITEGDIVEIISGPFKGEKAKVSKIDEAKEEITVELFEAMVSIPVTIRGDNVRVLEKESNK